MYPYLLLIIIPWIFSFVSTKKDKINGRTISFGVDEPSNPRNLSLFIFFVLFFLMLALRKETIGRDLANYKIMFYGYRYYSFLDLFKNTKEPLFRLINWIVLRFTEEYQWYLVVVALITVTPIAWLYNKDRSHGYLKLIIFVNMSTFIMIFSGLRQSMAMAIGIIAFICAKNKKLGWFLVVALMGMFTHHSGFILFVMYPLYNFKFTKKSLFYIAPIMVLIFIFNRPIFSLLSKMTSTYSSKYDADISSTGAFGTLILFVLFLAFCYIVGDEGKMDEESMGIRNFLTMAVIVQCFAPLHNLAMRMNYYFILFIPLALGDAVKNAKEEYKDIAKWGEIVLCVFFTVYFILNTYNSYKSGKSALDTIPYEFFWQN